MEEVLLPIDVSQCPDRINDSDFTLHTYMNALSPFLLLLPLEASNSYTSMNLFTSGIRSPRPTGACVPPNQRRRRHDPEPAAKLRACAGP